MRLAISLIAATSLLSGCMVAQGYSEKEQSIVDSLDGGQYQPASRQSRDNIETQNLLAQATFWSREAQLNPADLESAIKLTSAVRRMGNASQAVDIAQMARQMHPRDPYLLAEYAASLIADERGTEAMKPLQDGLRTTPAYGRLWSLMGAALDQQERYADARRHYDRALKITPNDPNVLANMGLSFALQGDAATAEKWLRRAAGQPGAGPGVAQNLDLVLQLQGKPTSQMAEAKAPVRTQQNRSAQSAQHPTWSRSTVQGPGVQMQSSQSPFAPHTGRQPSYGNANQNQFGQNQMAQGQLSNGQNFSVGKGAPRSAMDAARMAARQSGGRRATVPMGQDVPRSSVLVQNGGNAQMGAPQGYSQQGYSAPQMAPTAPPQGFAPQGSGPQGYGQPLQQAPQGYGVPQYPAGAYTPNQAAPQQAPQPRGAARRR
jgi:Flp pilus assembly protein TadD